MKTLLIGFLALSVLFFTSCKDNKEKNTMSQTTIEHDMESMTNNNHDKMMDNMHSDDNISTTKAGASKTDLSKLYSHYYHLTSALSKDDAAEAGTAATGIVNALATVDKSSFTEQQKKDFTDIEATLKEHAEHIAKKTGDIAHQREHLELLSTDIYDLAKSFGSGKTLFRIFCPMYNNNKGAYWLSSSKEVQNPYFGKEMVHCGEIKEEIK